MNTFYYCIFKLYKGVFKKEHKSNVHLFISPAPENQVFVFTLLGYSTTLEKLVCSLQWKNDVGLLDDVISTLKEYYEGNVQIIDELKSSISGDVFNFVIKPSNNGKNIKGPIQFKMLTKYSDKDTVLYSIDGQIELEKPNRISDKQLKMVHKTVSSKFKAFFKRLFS